MLSKFASCNSQVKTRLFRIFSNIVTWSNNGGLGIKGELLSRYLMFYGSVCNNTKTY